MANTAARTAAGDGALPHARAQTPFAGSGGRGHVPLVHARAPPPPLHHEPGVPIPAPAGGERQGAHDVTGLLARGGGSIVGRRHLAGHPPRAPAARCGGHRALTHTGGGTPFRKRSTTALFRRRGLG